MANVIKNIRVGIFGGTFDPVHTGHIELALYAKDIFHLDRVLFIPASTSPHKQGKPLTAAVHRLAMLALALEKFPEFSISMAEIKRQEVSYSIDTVDFLLETQADSEFYLIMGADTFLVLDTWKEYRRLTSLCHMLVGNRPGFPIIEPKQALDGLFGAEENPYRSLTDDPKEFWRRDTNRKICFFQIPPLDISSRNIRAGVIPPPPAKNILPQNVDRYIIVNQLYKERFALPPNE